MKFSCQFLIFTNRYRRRRLECYDFTTTFPMTNFHLYSRRKMSQKHGEVTPVYGANEILEKISNPKISVLEVWFVLLLVFFTLVSLHLSYQPIPKAFAIRFAINRPLNLFVYIILGILFFVTVFASVKGAFIENWKCKQSLN